MASSRTIKRQQIVTFKHLQKQTRQQRKLRMPHVSPSGTHKKHVVNVASKPINLNTQDPWRKPIEVAELLSGWPGGG